MSYLFGSTLLVVRVCPMVVFVTNYNFTGFVPDANTYHGLTVKRDQVAPPQEYREMTVCFRISVEVYQVMVQFVADGGVAEAGDDAGDVGIDVDGDSDGVGR